MKFELSRPTDYSDEAIISEIKRVALIVGKPLTIEKFETNSKYNSSTLRRRFGSWSKCLKQAGVDKSYWTRNSENSTDEIIEELKRVSEKLNSKSFTRKDFETNSDMNRHLFKGNHSFNSLMKIAGLEPTLMGRRYTDEERFENLMNVWIHCQRHYGREPYYAEMKEKPSIIGTKAYILRWGSWRKTLAAFLEKVNSGTADEKESIIEEQEQNTIQKIESDFLDENNRVQDCYVYLMVDTTNNYHKIGISNKPEYRERTLQSERPTIELVACEKFPNKKIASSIERYLHNTYSEKHKRGEWFDLNETEVTKIKKTLLSFRND